MKPIKIGTAQADVCRLTYVGEPGIGFNRIEKYFASFGASFGQGWGSSFSKGAKFLFEELFIIKVPRQKELSSSNKELFPNPACL